MALMKSGPMWWEGDLRRLPDVKSPTAEESKSRLSPLAGGLPEDQFAAVS